MKRVMTTLLQRHLQRQATKVRSRFVARALREHGFHIVQTAQALKMQRSYLYHLINRDPALRRLLQQIRLRQRLLRQARVKRQRRRKRAHA